MIWKEVLDTHCSTSSDVASLMTLNKTIHSAASTILYNKEFDFIVTPEHAEAGVSHTKLRHSNAEYWIGNINWSLLGVQRGTEDPELTQRLDNIAAIPFNRFKAVNINILASYRNDDQEIVLVWNYLLWLLDLLFERRHQPRLIRLISTKSWTVNNSLRCSTIPISRGMSSDWQQMITMESLDFPLPVWYGEHWYKIERLATQSSGSVEHFRQLQSYEGLTWLARRLYVPYHDNHLRSIRTNNPQIEDLWIEREPNFNCSYLRATYEALTYDENEVRSSQNGEDSSEYGVEDWSSLYGGDSTDDDDEEEKYEDYGDAGDWDQEMEDAYGVYDEEEDSTDI